MQQVGGGEALGDHVTGFHELERELKGIGIIEAASDDDGVIHKPIARGAGGDFRLERERFFDGARQAAKIVQINSAAQGVGQQIKTEQLAGISFGGGHTALFAGANQNQMLSQAGKAAGSVVGNADGDSAAAARMFQNQVGVGRFAGLRDGDYQRVLEVKRRAVERVNRRRGQRDGNAGDDVQQVPPKLGGIIGGATRYQNNQTWP